MIGAKLRYIRKRAGLSQIRAAELLDISRSTLVRYERTDSQMPISVFIQMLEIYDVDAKDVIETDWEQ